MKFLQVLAMCWCLLLPVYQQNAHITMGDEEILKFDEVTIDTGNAYNRAFGVFTAPITGTYIFWANVMGSGNSEFLILLKQDDVILAGGHTSHQLTYGVATLMYMARVEKGQHVWFANEQRGVTRSRIFGYRLSYYGGALLSTV